MRSPDADTLAALIEHQAFDVDAFGAFRRHRPAQHGVDARQQLARRERLGDVVVRAALEARHLVALFGARGEHDHRQLAGFPIALERARELQAAGVGEHPVDQQQVGQLVGDFGPAGARIGRFADFEARATQSEGDHFANRTLVFDDQNLFCGHVC